MWVIVSWMGGRGVLQRRSDLEEPSRKIRHGYFKAPGVAGGGFPGRAYFVLRTSRGHSIVVAVTAVA